MASRRAARPSDASASGSPAKCPPVREAWYIGPGSCPSEPFDPSFSRSTARGARSPIRSFARGALHLKLATLRGGAMVKRTRLILPLVAAALLADAVRADGPRRGPRG